MKNYEKDLEQIIAEAQNAHQEWISAQKATKASKQTRQDKIRDEIKERETCLEELAKKQDKARAALGEALMTADKEEAATIRGEIAAIEEEARDHQACIATLRAYNSEKAEAEAVQEVVTKYNAAIETSLRLTKEIDATLEEVKEEIARLEILKQKIEEARRSVSKKVSGTSAEERALIALYEESIGAIDVTGHSTASDDDAKLRYLRGNQRGIEGIPAFNNGTKATTRAAGKKLNENLGHS